MTEKTELQEWESVWERVRRKRPGADLAGSKKAFRIAMGLLKRLAQASGKTISIASPGKSDLTLVEYMPPPTGWVPIAYAQIDNMRDLVEKAGCKHATEASDEVLVKMTETILASPEWAEYLERLSSDFELDAAKLMMHADQQVARSDRPKLSLVSSPRARDENKR